VHGADPNWGRVAMAVGKCEDELDIDPTRVVIRFGDVETYPAPSTDKVLAAATEQMHGDEVVITVELGIADGAFTVYGCDLTTATSGSTPTTRLGPCEWYWSL